MWLKKIAKFGSMFSFSSDFNSPFFNCFLIKLGCCYYRCGLWQPFCIRLFLIGSLAPLGRPLSLSKVESVAPIFKRVLIELECWNFECRFGPTISMRIGRIFEIGSLCCPRDPTKEFGSPKSQFLHLLSDFY